MHAQGVVHSELDRWGRPGAVDADDTPLERAIRVGLDVRDVPPRMPQSDYVTRIGVEVDAPLFNEGPEGGGGGGGGQEDVGGLDHVG